MLNVTQLRPMQHKIHAAMIAAATGSRTEETGSEAVVVHNRKGDEVLLVVHIRHVPGMTHFKGDRNGFFFYGINANGAAEITDKVISALRS